MSAPPAAVHVRRGLRGVGGTGGDTPLSLPALWTAGEHGGPWEHRRTRGRDDCRCLFLAFFDSIWFASTWRTCPAGRDFRRLLERRCCVSDGASDEAVVVVLALRVLGYANVYGTPVAPWLCEEPIVVSLGEFERDSLQADGQMRGVRKLTVHVCMDSPQDAEITARAVAADLAGVDWLAMTLGPLRVLASDVGQPLYIKRDSSGRWIWEVPLCLTVVIEHG